MNEVCSRPASLDEASKVLSKGNIELMLLIAKEMPNNLTELAVISRNDFHKLSHKINVLSSKGFVLIENQGNGDCPVALFTDFEIVLGQ